MNTKLIALLVASSLMTGIFAAEETKPAEKPEKKPEAKKDEAAPAEPKAEVKKEEAPKKTEEKKEAEEDKKEETKTAKEAPKEIYLSPADCVEIALQNNLGLKIQRLVDRQSDLDVREAFADYLPTLRFSTTHTGNKTNGADSHSTTFSGGITQRSPIGTIFTFDLSGTHNHPGALGTRKSAAYTATITQPLWKNAGFDVGLYGIRSSRVQRKISRGNLELSVQGLIFEVREAYASIVGLIQQREVNLKSIESANTFINLTEAQKKAGLVTELDVFRAKVQKARRELDLTRTERALENANDNLKLILDVDLEERIKVQEEPIDFGEKRTADEQVVAGAKRKVVERRILVEKGSGTVKVQVYKKNGQDEKPDGEPNLLFKAERFDEKVILRRSLDNRLDLLNQRRSVAQSKLDALLEKDGLGHEVNLTGSYGRDDTGSAFGEASKFRDQDYSVGISVNLPWGKVSDRAAYERAILALKREEIQLKQVRQQIHFEVRDILRSLRESEKNLILLGQTVEQSKRTVEAVDVSFRRGRANAFDVTLAEDDLLGAKVAFIRAKQDYTVLLARLLVVIGKPTGRVDLSTKTRGGGVSSELPVGLKERGLPAIAPDPEPHEEDNP